MCRKKKLFIILCICFSLSACGKKEQEFRNNKISSEYTQNEDDHNKANSDQVQSQNTGKEGADVNDNYGLQIDTEEALVCGNVDELIENGCILKIGIENNDEYAMPVGKKQKKKFLKRLKKLQLVWLSYTRNEMKILDLRLVKMMIYKKNLKMPLNMRQHQIK